METEKSFSQFQFINKEKMFEIPDLDESVVEVIGNIYETPNLLN